ncbi:MAG: cell surface protein, partial [Acidimicrobiia bacterium]|nr:cell surface protein [Acidimicrobiia bacterium]
MTTSSTLRRIRSGIVAGALAVTAVATGAVTESSVASAAASPVVPATNTVTADALPTVQIDGVVWSQAIVGNTVYAGGKFNNARPAGAAPGTNLTPRANLLAYNLTTGELITSFAPTLNAQVLSVAASPDGTRVYVAGDFTTANGQTRSRIAAFNTATGQLISSFAPRVNSQARAIVATNSTVFVGGSFAGSGSTPRGNLAAFRASDGALLGWNPNADYIVRALALSQDNSAVMIGGSFQNIGGVAQYGLAKVDAVTGAVMPWNAQNTVRNAGQDSGVTSLTVDGNKVHGTTYHFGPGGNLEGPFQADVATGDVSWTVDCHGDSYSAYSDGATVYTVGHAHYCGNVGGGFGQTPKWTFQRALAFTRNATGTHLHEVLGYPNWGGTPTPSIVNWLPDVALGSFTGQDQGGWHVTGNGNYVVMGGEFPRVNGVSQQGLTRFAKRPIATNQQGPRFNNGQFVPTVQATSTTAARVSWTAGFDRDDYTLTYRVRRNNTYVHTTTANSNWWTLPAVGFVDTGLTPGATYNYQIVANDPGGNTVFGSSVSITMPTSFQNNAYATRVRADGASIYWPLNEASGTTAFDRAGVNDGLTGAQLTRGAAGAIAGDTATRFNNNDQSRIRTSGAMLAPDEFTIQAWVNKTAVGGRILGFSDVQIGNSGHRDRQIWMDNSGKIWFGVRNEAGNRVTINSSQAVNNGQWHQITATMSAAGMQLYVDGVPVAQRADTTKGETYVGYWRVGGDSMGSWSGAPSNVEVDGLVDEVAVYPTA